MLHLKVLFYYLNVKSNKVKLHILIFCFFLFASIDCSYSSRTISNTDVKNSTTADESAITIANIDEKDIPETEISKPILLNGGKEDNSAIDRHRVLTEIMTLMGKPYRHSGEDSSGFDCSGFVSKIFRDALGITLPRSTREQYIIGKEIARDSLKFGDLVFFKTKKNIPSHVGIYVGDGLFAHASQKIGVTISILDDTYYKKRYFSARRVIE